MEEFDIVYFLIFFIGASFGSFIFASSNRIAIGKDFIFTPSACDKCNTNLKPIHLIPIFSWIFLKGKCSFCGSKIDSKVLWFEIFCGIYFLVLFLVFGFSLEFLKLWIISTLFLMLAIIDLRLKAVPDYLLLVLAIISLIPISQNFVDILANFLIFCGSFFVLDFLVTFYIQNIKSRLTNNESLKNERALGEGDMIIAGAIGAILGLQFGIYAICLGAILAIIPSIFLIVKKNETQTPFIPFLAAGFLMILISKGLL